MKEFFHDEKGSLSMSRLLAFISIFPASYVVIATKSSEALAWYVSAYVLGYVGGKLGDKVGGGRVASKKL